MAVTKPKGTKKKVPRLRVPVVKLGWRMRDIVSDIEGIAVAKIEYLNGCIQYCIVPQYTPGAIEISSYYIDVVQLVKVNDGVWTVPEKITKKKRIPSERFYGANIKPQPYGGKRI